MQSKETSHSIKSWTIMLSILTSILLVFSTFSTRASGDAKTISSDQIPSRETWGTLPLSFEPNQGQTCDAVKFMSRGPSFTLSLMSSNVVLAGHSARGASPELALWIKLVSTNPVADIAGFDPLMGKSNYFICLYHKDFGDPPALFHFGNGSAGAVSIFSRITLVNLNPVIPSNVSIEINDDAGNPLSVNLNGSASSFLRRIVIAPDGAITLKTDGQGPLQTGSVVITSDAKVAGVILFGGSVGTAGVGDGKPLRKFAAPVETSPGVNTGIALMGLGTQQMVQLELHNQEGNIVARAVVPLAARSHLARFVTELPWDISPDFSNFSGTITAAGAAELAAIVLRISPGELATLPVAEKN